MSSLPLSILPTITTLSILVYLLLTGCQETTPTPAPPTPTAVLSAAIGVTPTLTAALNDVSAAHRPLTVWLPASFVPTPESPAAQVLEQAIDQFTADYPELPVEILPKADEGPASLLNYLRSGQQVAPAILPDLILLETQQLWQVAELGLVQPLTLTQLAFQDFYPFARESVAINERSYGAPYFADLIHLVYHPETVSKPPTTWAELVALDKSFAFPGGGRGGVADDWLILQYLESRTQSAGEAGVDREALSTLLNRLAAGRSSGLLPAQVATFSTPSAVWSAFSVGTVDLASVPAHLYLSQRQSDSAVAFAPLPTDAAQPQSLGRVYAFAVLTGDANRRTLALALIDQLLAPETQGAWSQAAAWAPTRPEAFTAWPETDEYVPFLQSLLAEARAFPREPAFGEMINQLQTAAHGVLTGSFTPEAALAEIK
jgi:ABC-type glycerol-3-phosphate transport system substrate-binding protein